MTNIDKINRVIWSCKTKDQINTCINWIKDLSSKTIITKIEYLTFLSICNVRLDISINE